MAHLVNHFANLGINVGANEKEIKTAYRTLAKKWHPDKNKNEGAKEKFQEMAASYEFLSSKDRREMHEREINNRLATASQVTETHNSRPAKQTKASSSSQHKTSSSSSQYKTSSSSSQYKTKKSSAASWSESFNKSYRSQQREQMKNQSATFFFTTTEGSGHDRFCYPSRDGEKHATFSYITHDVFDTLFEGYEDGPLEVTSGNNSAPRRKQRQRHVAPETFDMTGLATEYLFSPLTQSTEDKFAEKLPCPWCSGTFIRGKLFQHEEECGKFGLSADEDEECDSEEEILTQFRRPDYITKPSWQHQHEELISRIQKDKLNHRNRAASLDANYSDDVTCPYCQRKQKKTAAVRHIPGCRERMSKYGHHNPQHSKPGLSKGKVNK